LTKAVNDRPNMILMDIVMPEMDGYETCRQLRASDATKGIAVVRAQQAPERRQCRPA